MDDLFRLGNPVEHARRSARGNRVPLLLYRPILWSVMQGDVSEYIAIVQQQVAEARLANTCCVREHGIKNWLQFAGGA
jgi:hypothetical protein